MENSKKVVRNWPYIRVRRSFFGGCIIPLKSSSPAPANSKVKRGPCFFGKLNSRHLAVMPEKWQQHKYNTTINETPNQKKWKREHVFPPHTSTVRTTTPVLYQTWAIIKKKRTKKARLGFTEKWEIREPLYRLGTTGRVLLARDYLLMSLRVDAASIFLTLHYAWETPYYRNTPECISGGEETREEGASALSFLVLCLLVRAYYPVRPTGRSDGVINMKYPSVLWCAAGRPVYWCNPVYWLLREAA